MTLLTPKEILESNPEVAKSFNWYQIGHLLNMKLVRGKKMRRTCQVCLEDVIELAKLKKA